MNKSISLTSSGSCNLSISPSFFNKSNEENNGNVLLLNPLNFIYSETEWMSVTKIQGKATTQLIINNTPTILNTTYFSKALKNLRVDASSIFSSKKIIGSLCHVGVPLKKRHIKQLLRTIDQFREELCSKKPLPVFYNISTVTISSKRTKKRSYRLQILSKESMQLYFPEKNSSRIGEGGSKICEKIFPISSHRMVLAQTIAKLPLDQKDIFSHAENRILSLKKSHIGPKIYGIFHQFFLKNQTAMLSQHVIMAYYKTDVVKLINHIASHDVFYSDYEKLKISIKIIEGVKKLHDQGIVHRDLKPDNILIAPFTKKNLSKKKNPFLVLIDFDTSCCVSETEECLTAGTLPYIPPEKLIKLRNMHKPSFSEDIWSLGCLLWCIWGEGYLYPWFSMFNSLVKLDMEEIARCFREKDKKALTLLDIIQLYDSKKPSAAFGPLASIIWEMLRKKPERRADIRKCLTSFKALKKNNRTKATSELTKEFKSYVKRRIYKNRKFDNLLRFASTQNMIEKSRS